MARFFNFMHDFGCTNDTFQNEPIPNKIFFIRGNESIINMINLISHSLCKKIKKQFPRLIGLNFFIVFVFMFFGNKSDY
jgi:hypothetical protein